MYNVLEKDYQSFYIKFSDISSNLKTQFNV